MLQNPDSSAPLVLIAGSAALPAAALLREAGCEVRLATTAAATCRLAAANPAPQLLLLGESVGEHGGIELLRRLRNDDATAALPILYVGGGDEELALALGAADCLSLPLRPLVLLARVQVQLELQRLLALESTFGGLAALDEVAG
jgi:putative two-component system response regulator